LRRFIQEVPGKLISAFYSTRNYHIKNEAEQAEVINKLLENLRIVEREIQGPFVLGDTFTLADALLYPWFERWSVNEQLFGIKLPEELTKIKAFIAAVQSRPSVQKALSEVTEEFYVKGYESYMKP
jgi:glutathione S-transferase